MTDWQTPRELPDLRRIDRLAIDTETKDGGLQEDRGSSWPWGSGHICGISIAWREASAMRSAYFPLQHPDTDCFDRANVARWLKDHIAAGVTFVTLNGLYDWGWLGTDLGVSIPPADQLDELGALAVTIDENHRSYSLAAICERLGLPGKDETILREAVMTAGLVPKRRKKINLQSHIWQLPARFVGPYAEADAERTLEAFETLVPELDREGLRDAYRLDVDLMPMVLAMRRRGIRIDQGAAERARDLLLGKRDAALAEISRLHGLPVGMDEINGRDWKIKTFDSYGIEYPRTAKGAPSFTGNAMTGWMPRHPHWLPQLIARANKYEGAGTKFLEGHILQHVVNGRIFAEIRPFKIEEGGARSSRFSYADPPLQQMPIKDDEIGPLIRPAFLPEEGEWWAHPDIKQQEFCWLMDRAAARELPGAAEAVAAWNADPATDFHAWVGGMTGLRRDFAKVMNFAKIYGAGVKKLAEMVNKPVAETQVILAQYDAALPFVAQLSQIEQERARRVGYTEMPDGARRHWSLWEAAWIYAKGAGPCDVEEARRRRNDPAHAWFQQTLQRHKTYTALNALIQGSAARHTKLWMRAVWREGITPMLQMHDSLSCSVTAREPAEMVARLACEVVKLAVPVRVDLKYGKSWGDAIHAWEDRAGGPKSFSAANPVTADPANDVTDPVEDVTADPVEDDDGAAEFADPFLAALDEMSAEEVLAQAGVPKWFATLAYHGSADLPGEPGDGIDLADLIGNVPSDRKISCPFHADRSPSLHVYTDHYYCFGCGAHGDRAGWLMRAGGLDYVAALHVLGAWDGVAVPGPGTIAGDGASKAPDPERIAHALKWWNEAQPIAGTLAERYLAETRGIDLAVLPADVSERALRFHHACVFGPGAWHPCLLALMRDPLTSEPTGIQRIALTSDAQKIDCMMLGPAGAVMIWPASDQLVIGEGLETTLAAATRLPYRGAPLRPAWSVLSDGGMRSFPVIDGISRLIILADHDINGVGQAAAEECKQRWFTAGRRGAVLTPPRPGSDFNDIVIERLTERAA